MKSIAPLLPLLTLLPASVTGSVVPRYLQPHGITRRDVTADQVQRELGAQLSDQTTIFGPSDAHYANATKRYSNYKAPQIQVVIEAGQESDIPKIIQYSNENSIEWMIMNTGHGFASNFGAFGGIAIKMLNLRSISIQPDGKSAWFGGGTRDGEATEFLWDRGFVVTTGSCECVGMVGAGLGGGHGRLEGHYGMVGDNILQLNVVLADGTPIVVNETSNSDLLWAMKGAGHNFGVVTSFEMAIHPRGPDTWYYHNYIWSQDKLEAVFEALNDLHGNGTTPVDMAVNWGGFFYSPYLSAAEPLMTWQFAFRGSEEDAAPYFTAFNAIGALMEESDNIPYPGIAHTQLSAMQDPICTDTRVRISTTVGTEIYNITAERQIMDLYRQTIQSNPSLAETAYVLHEGYSTAGVTAIESDSTAYPFRSDHHLMLFAANLQQGASQTLVDAAWVWAKQVRNLWNAGQPERLPHAYVNYANGDEPVEQKYGYEQWRLNRLRDLKAKYDPSNRFRFFNPIIEN